MNFKIKSLILWPKNKEKQIRRIDFELNKVNIITGGSEKGKSAIISIIDYCLASGSCRIPTRKIRHLTDWFGIIVELEDNNQILLARKEPGDQQISGEMYLKEGQDFALPLFIESNVNVADVKKRLNDIAKLSDIPIGDGSHFDSRPSFRDLMSFVFQPQYIIANQSTLFYRADSMPQREKLRSIFPYLLGAVDNNYLLLKEELKDIDRDIDTLNREIEKQKKLAEKFSGRIKGYYIQAKELGLLKNYPYPEDSWLTERYVDSLKTLTSEINDHTVPVSDIANISQTSSRISTLTSQELDLAFEINGLKHRHELLQRLVDSNRNYRDDLLDQFGRLKTSGWFMELLKNTEEKCPLCETKTDTAKAYVKQLINVNKGILEKGAKLNDNHTILLTESKRISQEIGSLTAKLNKIRDELNLLKSGSEKDNKLLHTINSIYQFVGRIESELAAYENYTSDNDTASKIGQLKARKSEIELIVNKESVANRILRSKRKLIDNIKYYAKKFEAENCEELANFNERDLTLNFTSETGRIDSLYEIGSGANYMAYHISTSLAFQEYFISQKFSPIPSFLILDQPTQVYFPEADVENAQKSEDLQKVRKIFEILHDATKRTQNKLQIIVLEHVGQFAWEGLDTMERIKRWRIDEKDNALIPQEWFS